MVNFNSVVADAICKPKLDGHVLYTRIDGTYEDSSNKSVKLSDEYRKKARGKDNSPDNMRKLFITYNGVYTQYHRGLEDGKLLHERAYDSKVGNLKYRAALAGKLGINKINAMDMLALHNQNPNKDDIEFEELKGTGLGALVRPWVMQNIEEIYIDWLPFSNYVKNGAGSLTDLSDSLMGCIEYMLADELGDGSLDKVRARFPRLHTVAYIPNLDNLYNDNKDLIVQESDINERVKSWIEKVVEKNGKTLPKAKYITMFNGCVYRLTANPAWMLHYSCKDGLYKFDADVLKDHFEGLVDKYNNNYSNLKKENSNIEKDIDDKQTDLEKSIIGIENTIGLSTAINLLISEIAHKNITISDIQKFSSVNRDRYLGYIEKYCKKKG